MKPRILPIFPPPAEEEEGWGAVVTAVPMWHWFRQGVSLCERYKMNAGPGYFDPLKTFHPANCLRCWRRLEI